MTKQETLIMKGIAFLMMILVHVDMSRSTQLLHIGGYSVLKIIKGGCSPVAFFLMLSGYGLMYVYEHGDSHHYGRILKLFVHYWCVLLLFVPLGYFMVGGDVYPGNCLKILENVTSFHTSYNYECWFLFPFAIISLSYPLILKLFERMGGAFLIFSIFLYFASGFIISHNHLIYKTAPHLMYNILQVPFLLFSFLIGAYLKKCSVPEWIVGVIRKDVWMIIMPIFVIVLLLACATQVKTTAFGPFTAVLMFLSLLMLIKGHECRWLQAIGKHSMNMWMVHSYILYYLFKDAVYSLKYTILVVLATLILSFICSVVIKIITCKIDKVIYDYRF